MATWLTLKAITRSSILQNYQQQKKELCALCKRSESAFSSDINFLRKKNFLCLEGTSLKLISWSSMSKLLEINLTAKKIIQHEINSKTTVQQWIIATDIEHNQQRQSYMILKQVNKNPEKKQGFINAMVKDGADRERLSTDNGYFLSMLQSLYLSDFVQASAIHEDLIKVRPDTNRSVRGMARAWSQKDYKVHPTTISYWKNKLQTAGIIDVSKLSVTSEDRVRNEFCHVIWLNTKRIRRQFPDRAKLQTMLQLCDQITVLQPWQRLDIEKLLAA